MSRFVLRPSTIVASVVSSSIASSAAAGLVESFVIGSGAQSSHVQIQFANGNSYLYEVRYDVAGTGRSLFDAIAAAQPGYFAFETIDFSFGTALFGISVGGDSNAGFGTPPAYLDYWHYWTRGSADASWSESWVGFGARIVSDGSWDGWVFDSASEPAAVPVPGAGVIPAVGVLMNPIRRRRRLHANRFHRSA